MEILSASVIAALKRYCDATALQEADERLDAVEAVLAARESLVAALVASGWRPPARIEDQVHQDHLLLSMPAGVVERLGL